MQKEFNKMAPSPELKASGETKTNAENNIDSGAREPANLQRTSNQQNVKDDIPDDLNEREYIHLLDEAITYKSPKDLKSKSDTFKKLLIKAEQEEREHFPFESVFNRGSRNSNRHTQGGSLQNLSETDNCDGDFFINTGHKRNHRDHQNRQQSKKYSSSVSSRQREGGSLPCNVNVSSAYSDHIQPFLNEDNKRRTKNELFSTNHEPINYNRLEESQLFGQKSCHTIIDIYDSDETKHLLACETLAQDKEPLRGDDGTELNSVKKLPRVSMSQSYTTHAKLEISFDNGEGSNRNSMSCVDKTVAFPIETQQNLNTNVESTPVQLGNYNSVKSLTEQKVDMTARTNVPNVVMSSNVGGIGMTNAKFISNFSMLQQPSPLLDENGNAVQPFNSSLPTSSQPSKIKKTKIPKADRNTIIKKSDEMEGYRGTDEVEDLLRFIENIENPNTKSTKNKNTGNQNKNTLVSGGGVGGGNGGGGDKNNKKKKKFNNENNGKLQRSNSLEELSSCSKLKNQIQDGISDSHEIVMEETSEELVILRSKEIIQKSENLEQQQMTKSQFKRSERRSWGGNEEYLNENEISKPKIENSILAVKKMDEVLVNSIESITTGQETAEFQMVTKKRKTKKKPNYFNDNNHGSSYGKNSGNYNRESKNNTNRTKYQNSFATDRDAYLNSFSNSSDNRRKSTSSVPPSEKSDSSDLDSVHSLPVESTSNRNNQLVQQNAALVSYADIAKTANMDKTPLDQWPTITKNDFIDNSNVSTCSSSNSSKSQNSIQTVRSSCNEFVGGGVDEQKHLSYSESLLDDKIIIQNGGNSGNGGNGENFIKKIKKKEFTSESVVNKNLLHKSKSVESDNYLGIDQYPALEKTIKKHSGQIENLVPAVFLLNKNTTTTTAIKNKQTKQQSKEITAILTETQTIETEMNQKNRQQNVPNFTTTTTCLNATATSQPIFYDNLTTKRCKKEKINEILVNHRPAVIILNDVDTNKNDVNDEITFGFEINKQLLYGDFNEDELLFIESSNDQTTNNSTDFGYTSSSSSPKDNLSTDDLLNQQTNKIYINNNNRINKFEIISSSSSSPPQQQQSIECISISGAISSSPIDQNKKCASSVVVDDNSVVAVVDNSDLIVNDINSNSSLNLISCNNNIEVNRVIVVVDENNKQKQQQQQQQQPQQQKEQNKINSVKELNIIYKAPAVDPKFSYNHAKIVDFVGLAWEDIIRDTKSEAQYYNGQ